MTAINLCYFNNGLSFRNVPTNYVAQSGEVLFSDYATSGELASAFPNYTALSAANTAVNNAGIAIATGVQIISTGTPALNGTYDIDSEAQGQINAIITYILLNATFPAGASALPWYDSIGQEHTFPSIASFKAFATAIADYVAAVAIYGNSGGQNGSLPSNEITIA